MNPHQRVLVVADVSNLFYCVKKKFGGKRLNYKKYLDKAVGPRILYRAIAYGAEMENEAASFKLALSHFGYETKYKKPKCYPGTEPGREIRKADWDVGIAMDVVRMLDSVDVVVFGTADCDLAACVDFVKSRGKIAEVLACGISRELKEVAPGNWEEVDDSMVEDPTPKDTVELS